MFGVDAGIILLNTFWLFLMCLNSSLDYRTRMFFVRYVHEMYHVINDHFLLLDVLEPVIRLNVHCDLWDASEFFMS